MTTTIIDSQNRAVIPGASPSEEYLVIEEQTGFRLERMTREQVRRAIQASPLHFPRDWEEMRSETREL